MKRRAFSASLVATMSCGAVRAQAAGVATVGYMYSTASTYMAPLIAQVRTGLAEEGFVEGRNLSILALSAEGHYERLAEMARELAARKVDVIFASGSTEPAKAALAAATTTPIVFLSGTDPVRAGIVASLNRPGGRVTGISLIGTALEAKRLDYLAELVPGSGPLGALINPATADAPLQIDELNKAAELIKRPILIVHAATSAELDSAFAELHRLEVVALSVTQAPLFAGRPEPIVALAARYRIPAIYSQREYAAIGGLVSFGTSFRESYRQAGLYLGRVLKGAKPAELSVLQPTHFELVVNLKTARAQGLAFPPAMLAAADEVIE